MIDENNFNQLLQQIEILTQVVESLPDHNARTKSIELLQSLMEYHAAAIERVMEIIAASDAKNAIFADLANDELAASVLLLYGLHPLGIEARVEKALEKVRPYLKSHGGNAELAGVADGVVRLHLSGSCDGCPSSSETLKNAIEKAIYEAAPDVVEIKVDDAPKKAHSSAIPTNFVQIVRNGVSPNDKNLAIEQ